MDSYYIESPRTHLEPDGMEFFLQHNGPKTVSAGAHIHDAVEFLYIRQGSYIARADGAEYTLHPGDLILFCANSIHHVVTGSCADNCYYVIKILPTVLMNLSPKGIGAGYLLRFTLNRPDQKRVWTRGELEADVKILSVLNSLIQEKETGCYGSEALIKLKMAELLLLILRADVSQRPDAPEPEITGRIFAAMRYVREHFSEDIDEQVLARELGLSYSYFSRSFQRVTGMRFRKYLNAVRVDRAEQMLLTTDRSVTEVAFLCGYNHVSYFISVYRKFKGTTPHRTGLSSKLQ